ncbi:hypothetical protein GQ53DRAFT_841093 [Thozetella sp. PMI_491]|nr:hypothetical protein GQ53DRAFT_841093 [Thozetella sp. PMI_491]
MVNIAGRSKGCSTCRRRRVKCDESRPVCRRCQRWNFECDGPRGITIIYEETKRSRTSDRQDISKDSLEERRDAASTGLAQSHTFSPEATLRVVGLDVYICYTQNNLRRDGFIFTAIQTIKPADLLPIEFRLETCQISHQAILSLATILFGTQHQQSDITRQGYRMYGDALRQLNHALSDATRYTSNEVIVAVAALAISELLVPTGPDNYLPHMVGLERLIALRDPHSFWSEKPTGFREGIRFMILFASLRIRKASIFADPDWTKAMRSNLSAIQLYEQDLFDVLAICTVLTAKSDVIIANSHLDAATAARQRDELDGQAQALLAQLRAWKVRWDNLKTSSHSPEACPTVGLIKGAEGNDFRVVLIMLYNMTLIHVLQILASIPFEKRSAAAVREDNPQPTKDGYLTEKRLAALEACRWIRYYLKGYRQLDLRTSTVVHWTISTVWTELRNDDSVEGSWMRDLLIKKGRQVVAHGIWSTYKWLGSLPE